MNLKNSTYEVHENDLNSLLTVDIPYSKSYANRLLILAAIKKGKTKVYHISSSSDVEAMIDCFKKIGLHVYMERDSVVIDGSFPECEDHRSSEKIQLYTGDGGTTNRFLMPLLARGKKQYEMIPDGHMRNRPMQELANALLDLGVSVKQSDSTWYEIQGPIKSGKIVDIDCQKSTQFLTGLALSCADLDVVIRPKNLEASLLYWKITEKLIHDFQKDCLDFVTPVDFSSASYPLALGAVIRPVIIRNCLSIDVLQADAEFINILKVMGVAIKLTKEGLSLAPPDKLLPIDVDGSQFPDLIPTLAFVCSYSSGKSKLRNLSVLRHKESDRVEETIKILRSFNIDYTLDSNDNLEIRATDQNEKKNRIELFVPQDHRMVMIGYLFLRKNKGGIIHNAGHVAKSYPDFFMQMDK